jgi:hypothetical protein
MTNAVSLDVTQRGSCKNRVSEERIASVISVKRIQTVGSYKSHTAPHPRRPQSSRVLQFMLVYPTHA